MPQPSTAHSQDLISSAAKGLGQGGAGHTVGAPVPVARGAGTQRQGRDTATVPAAAGPAPPGCHLIKAMVWASSAGQTQPSRVICGWANLGNYFFAGSYVSHLPRPLPGRLATRDPTETDSANSCSKPGNIWAAVGEFLKISLSVPLPFLMCPSWRLVVL